METNLSRSRVILSALPPGHVALGFMRAALMTLCILVPVVFTVRPARAQFTLPARGLVPSEISQTLIVLDGEIPGVATVYMSGKPKYDEFFYRSAKIHGTFVAADWLTKEFGAALAQAASGILEVPSADPAMWPDLLDSLYRHRGSLTEEGRRALEVRGSQLAQLFSLLPSAGEDLGKAAADVPGLVEAASQDFRGLSGVMKLPKVIWSLRKVGGELAGDVQRAGATIAAVRSLTSGYARFGAKEAETDSSAQAPPVVEPAPATEPAPQASQASPAPPAEPAFMPNLECDHLSGQMGSTIDLTCRVTKPTGEAAPGVVIEFYVSMGGTKQPVGRAKSAADGMARLAWTVQTILAENQMMKKVPYSAIALPTAKIIPTRRADGDVLVAK